MADFHQGGIITTLHPLYEAFDREKYLVKLEKNWKSTQTISILAYYFPLYFQR